MKVRFNRERKPATSEEIAALEASVGRALPRDFASFLAERNGSGIQSNVFPVGDDNSSGVNKFLSTAVILKDKTMLGERMSEHAWPIADAEGGNYVCLRYQPPGEWVVVFWDHETEEEPVLQPSFVAFLESLEKFDAASVELKPGQVVSGWVDPELLKQFKDD